MTEEYVGRKFETVFTGSAREWGSQAVDLVLASHFMDALGLTPENAGNLSVRLGGGFLITPGGINKRELSTTQLVEVEGFDGRKASVIGSLEPSSEVPMHWLIYDTYPNVNAVVHVHDMKMVEGPPSFVPVTPETEYGTKDQAIHVAELIEKSPYVVIAGHGVVGVGRTLLQSVFLVERMHRGSTTDIDLFSV
ncbi:MAG: hypothetical protein GF334_07710 [Candidatus Altiarchaeales archaeon]|nr:hypothetical protein [Candidatus Altiarchaeales archaeon]